MPGTLSGSFEDSTALRATFSRLLADLADAAHDDVVDERGIRLRAIHQCVDDLAREIRRMPAGQATGFARAGRARRGDDVCSAHNVLDDVLERKVADDACKTGGK